MSGASELDIDPPQDLAAEYVLGTLDAAEAAAAERRAAADPAFAAEIRAWESRLLPLTSLIPPLQPPAAVWQRVEDTTGGNAAGSAMSGRPTAPAANDNAVRRWRIAAIAGYALAAALAAFIGLRPPPAPAPAPVASLAPDTFAVLLPTGSTAPVLVVLPRADGAYRVRATGALNVAANHDLQLWALPAGATKPVSLGLLPVSGTQVSPGVATGTKILVSLEPKGGSPTGQPTGAVVYGGTLERQ